MHNNIIDGNDSTEGIVSIDYYPIKTGENIVIFKEVNGEVQREFRRLPFTILSSEPVGKYNWIELDGNQKYKYQLDVYDLEEFYKIRNSNENFWSVYNYQENIMLRHGLTYFKGIKKLQDLRNLAVDIETTGLEFLADDAKVVIISNTYDINGVRGKKLFAIDEFESEVEMLIAWASWLREINPSNILNHNIFKFDLPYLIIRAKRLGIRLEIGRDRSEPLVEQWESKFRKDQNTFFNYRKIRIFGRNVIDTWYCAIDYDRVSQKYPNYKLKELAKFEKLAIEDREYYDAKLIGQNYTNPIEMAKIKAYADEDSREALDLFYIFCQTKFLINKHVPKSFTDLCLSATGSMVNSMMVRSYLQIGHSIAETSEKKPYEGAITLGNTGIYNNCLKIDVASLYPSIMLVYKVENIQKDPYGHFLKMVRYFTEERLRHKKLAKETGDSWYKVLEQVEKVFCNSFYGALGTNGTNYNYLQGADFVTRKGREIILKTMEWATGIKND